MAARKRRFRIGLVVLVTISLFLCPFADYARAAMPPGQVPFTPNILPLLITPTPLFSGFNPLSEGLARVEGNMLWVGGRSFSIGCEFDDASMIPTGASTQSATGLFGYSVIEGAPDYRLIWITLPGTMFGHGGGERRYLVIRADDPLFSGVPNVDTGDGFEDYLGEVIRAESTITLGAGGIGSGLAAGVLGQLLLCAPTIGTSCVTALITAAVAIIGGGTTAVLNLFAWIHEGGNVLEQFHTIALECTP